jgi:glycosyltransferase involved in cell wall biosynthesis
MVDKTSLRCGVPLLSFCIPTFNRSESVSRLVRSILACNAHDIEVIVVNNASPDSTIEELDSLSDGRFDLYSNSENRGALYNMLRALSLGRGKYLIYCTDQDYFLGDQLDEFLELLRGSVQVSCGFCLLPGDAAQRTRSVVIGYEAMIAVAYRSRHPTGYFFRNEDLKTIGFPEKFDRFEDVELFPLEFVFAELALMGNALIYRKGLFRPEVSKRVAEHKSSTTDGKSRNAFFSPASRLRMTLKFVKHLDGLALSKFDAIRIEASVFLSGAWAASVGYRYIMANERLCAHYRMAVEKISVLQSLTTSVHFMIDFFIARKSRGLQRMLYAIVIIFWAVWHFSIRVLRKAVDLCFKLEKNNPCI